MTEKQYEKDHLENIGKRIENEISHLQKPTIEHISKIVDEITRSNFPVGAPMAPIHDDDYYGPDFDFKDFPNCYLAKLVSNDTTFAWKGDC